MPLRNLLRLTILLTALPALAQVPAREKSTDRALKGSAAVKEKGTGALETPKDPPKAPPDKPEKPDKPAKPEKTAYDFELPGPDGKGVPLAGFKGKTLLIVNLARNSSLNAQLPALEKLSETYKDKGVVVLGVPSNDFGAAEPGTDPEIQKVYKVDDKVTFPVMARASLEGVQEIPLYTFLTKGKAAPKGGPVHWNYTKFIVDKTGKPVARFDPDVAPDSPELLATLDQILDGRYKPKKGGDSPGGGPPGGGDDDDDGP